MAGLGHLMGNLPLLYMSTVSQDTRISTWCMFMNTGIGGALVDSALMYFCNI